VLLVLLPRCSHAFGRLFMAVRIALSTAGARHLTEYPASLKCGSWRKGRHVLPPVAGGQMRSGCV
jgi:hypothetical protein